ncbi:Uu.00g032310.m01.CDS01 [Anthostomella pinea]|uniref:Uu.00g032310.m01.CDS01 n=1 Tax=Anthostomella pinea TaxID=933095 RepID=A0AAI8V3S1_9PEZI|nr:Uu.00g032310.m01.CDS01 [Anthostomella pinea]
MASQKTGPGLTIPIQNAGSSNDFRSTGAGMSMSDDLPFIIVQPVHYFRMMNGVKVSQVAYPREVPQVIYHMEHSGFQSSGGVDFGMQDDQGAIRSGAVPVPTFGEDWPIYPNGSSTGKFGDNCPSCTPHPVTLGHHGLVAIPPEGVSLARSHCLRGQFRSRCDRAGVKIELHNEPRLTQPFPPPSLGHPEQEGKGQANHIGATH